MQAFSFGQMNAPGQRNYVFVDEHNRHKRLKVMRACEGCRRRKIKCDAATTNAWPCSSCNRLKLQCVPPTLVDQDLQYIPPTLTDQGFCGSDRVLEPLDASNYQFVNANVLSTSHDQKQPVEYEDKASYGQFQPTRQVYQPPLAPYSANLQPYSTDGQQRQYGGHYEPTNATIPEAPLSSQPIHAAEMPPIARTDSGASEHGSATAEGLSEVLGSLKIDETGTAQYFRRPSKSIAEPAAPVQDQEVEVPALDTRYGSQIRIPPALMPSEEDCAHYFKIFFCDVHPYVPVVNRSHFYHQWQSDRSSLSPLLIEAMLACAGRLSDDPAQGAQWLALANRHEDSFLDTPRLSTMQALLLLLKAREAAPKRGYYYRSWMTCKTIASMAKDLDLHEHHDTHTTGQPCGSNPVECLTKTRVWQTLMVCEMMIGGPQGRYDFDVDIDTVDISPNPPCSGPDRFEAKTSRQFAYLVRNVRNIRAMTETYHELRKTKDWGGHPKFVANNQAFESWPDALPQELQLTMPADGSRPWIPSHFIGNMHSYYQLGRIMLQRPQLMALKSFAADSDWKQRMTSCYTSAKILCRIQEAVFSQFGLHGLLCMQRGINFTIYAILTCIMLHLVAITSPDPELYGGAREYFTRHMRILEECINAWPMQEMRAQIDALREAFSANKDKPFELKMTFPYGTPSDSQQQSPPMEPPYQRPHMAAEESFAQPMVQPYPTQVLTPPISAISHGSEFDSPLPQQHAAMLPPSTDPVHAIPGSSQIYPQLSLPAIDERQWNPSPIFQQWDTAFSIPQAALAPPPPSTLPTSAPVDFPVIPDPNRHVVTASRSNFHLTQYPSPAVTSVACHPQQHNVPQQRPNPQTLQSVSPAPSFVSPKEWQQSVASVFGPEGLKRGWAFADMENQPQKRAR